jgi:hypothetical protein
MQIGLRVRPRAASLKRVLRTIFSSQAALLPPRYCGQAS